MDLLTPPHDVRVALVGLGYWGPNLLRNLVNVLGDANVVLVDRRVDRLAAASAHYPALACALTLEQALDEHDVNAVVIATPVSTHHELAVIALEHGCHVMVEKPLAMTTEQGVDLVLRAERAGLTLMVGHTFLFSPRVELVEQCVAEGRLGEVQYVTSARLNLGLHQPDVSVIWDLAPHDLSIIARVLGTWPVRVRTSGRGVVRSDRPDVAFMHFDFPSGVIGSVTVSWLAPSKARNTVIVGDRQMLVYDDLQIEQPVQLYDKGVMPASPGNFGEHQLTYRNGDVLAPCVPAREPLAQEIAHFVRCVSEGTRCRSDGRFGLQVVQALEAAEQSWAEGGASIDIKPLDTLLASPWPESDQLAFGPAPQSAVTA
jgi:predicted dehydrogenase